MDEITYKQLLDRDGSPSGLELWQGGRHITVSFTPPGNVPSGYKWEEVKGNVDRLCERAKEEVQRNLKAPVAEVIEAFNRTENKEE